MIYVNFAIKKTEPVIPQEIFWCKYCNVPVLRDVNDPNKYICPCCNNKMKYLGADLRPVFPEERLLFEILSAKPFDYANCSVWANNNKYYLDGMY